MITRRKSLDLEASPACRRERVASYRADGKPRGGGDNVAEERTAVTAGHTEVVGGGRGGRGSFIIPRTLVFHLWAPGLVEITPPSKQASELSAKVHFRPWQKQSQLTAFSGA